MANITSPSTSTSISITAPLSPPDEINFEELISASVLNEQNDEKITEPQSENEPEAPKNETVPEPVQKITTLTKIIPKSTSSTTTAKLPTLKSPNAGHVVLIQGPTGAPVPIRIAASNAGGTTTTTTTTSMIKVATASSTTVASGTTLTTSSPKVAVSGSTKDSPKQSPVTIQVLKMPDGSLVQIKNNKALNLTNLSNISQLNVGSGSPLIVKTTNGQKTVIGAPTKLGTGSPVLKSLTLAEAQLAGYIKKPTDGTINKLQKILPAPLTIASTSTTVVSTPSTATASNSGTKEITIKSETDGTTKQIVVPQHMVKLNSSGGSIQTIQIPGKSGMQYVRVLAPGTSGVGAKIMTTIKKGETSPTKSPLVGTHRIVMNANGKPTLSIVTSKDGPIASKVNTKIISTVPTLRKIQEPGASKSRDADASPASTLHLMQIKKVSPSLNTSLEPPKVLNSQAPSNVAMQQQQQQQLRRLQLTQNKSLVSTEQQPRTKQYSTLKSPPLHITLKTTPDLTDDQISMIFSKRSPTPEALRRKHCNCTKSQCLKLYCDCFANGEFCQDCNCKECFNNLEYEDERQKAIKICLERNPNAFKPKITKAKDQSDLRLHNKGCNCKRSGCLKNYCECYEAKIACSANCKCFGCRNVEDRSERGGDGGADDVTVSQPVARQTATKRSHDDSHERPSTSTATTAISRLQQQQQDGPPPNKQPYNFITQEVVDATIQCMIAQADECKRNGMSNKVAERMIIEELGRCLVEIIDFSIRNMDN